jgi:organic radical activating enzyme
MQELLLSQGKLLPIMEEFYSLQGEGRNTGKAAYFIRVGGCDVGCYWCDVKESWNADLHPLISADTVINNALQYSARSVVVTGGEPALYNLTYLTSNLKRIGFETFLETSGSEVITGMWDWICISPKKISHPLESEIIKAHELKVIISDDSDFEWAEENAILVREDCFLYLQPEWSKIDLMMPKIVDYILNHPKWQISLQSHKYMRIP